MEQRSRKSVNQSPRWNPGIQNGKPVRVLYSSDPNSNSGLIEKGINIQKKSLKSDFFSLWQFCSLFI
jgi:hypothetical protein